MVSEQLCFSHPRVFLSVSFVNLHTQAEVSFPIWNGCPKAFKASFNIFLLCMVLPSNLSFSRCLVWPRILYWRNIVTGQAWPWDKVGITLLWSLWCGDTVFNGRGKTKPHIVPLSIKLGTAVQQGNTRQSGAWSGSALLHSCWVVLAIGSLFHLWNGTSGAYLCFQDVSGLSTKCFMQTRRVSGAIS